MTGAPEDRKRARLNRDVWSCVPSMSMYACRGAYFPKQRTCLVELTFTVNRSFAETQALVPDHVLASSTEL